MFNSCNGKLTIESIIPNIEDISKESMELTQVQQDALEMFEAAYVQLHWVVSALRHCDDEISEHLRTDMKRIRAATDLETDSREGTFVHFFPSRFVFSKHANIGHIRFRECLVSMTQ